MPTPVIFTITTAGRVAALDAFDNGLTIALTECGIGSSSYTPDGTETALDAEIDRFNLSGGTVESLSATLRFSTAMTATAHTEVFEIGLFTSTGVLFAVASTTSTTVPLTVVEANIDTICAFGMVLGDVPASSLTITIDPNAPLAVVLLDQHLGAANPHPQYGKQADLLAEVAARTNGDLSLSIALAAEITARGIATAQATETTRGTVEKATQIEMNNGASGLFPDAATIRNGFEYAIAGNGHFVLPTFLGSLIVQWGSVLGDGTGEHVTFPIPFPSNICSVQVTDGASGCNICGVDATYSLSEMTLFARDVNGTYTSTQFSWVAIGF